VQALVATEDERFMNILLTEEDWEPLQALEVVEEQVPWHNN
jgi:hypothetical protein